MRQLISKIQFNNFETGEFILAGLRTYDQLTALIEIFPWTQQRAHFVVGLWGPSITIEASSGRFLKLSMYYNRKFILYFLNGHNQVFQKVLTSLDESYPYIRRLYADQLRLEDFNIKSTWSRHVDKHFATGEFTYTVSIKSAFKFLLYSSWFAALPWLILPVELINGAPVNWQTLVCMLLFLFIFGGMNFFVFFNYYLYGRDKVLILSKGDGLFYFGSPENFKVYKKTDIDKIIQIQHSGSRNPLVYFALYVIQFRDGTLLQIPNILIRENLFSKKFNDRLFTFKGGNILVKRNRKLAVFDQ